MSSGNGDLRAHVALDDHERAALVLAQHEERKAARTGREDHAREPFALPALYEVPDAPADYSDDLSPVLGRARSLSDWRKATPPTWLVEGLLQRGSLTFFTATTGAGKSLLVQDLVLRLAAGIGGAWLDAYAITPGTLRVLVVEAENGTNRLGRRAHELVLGGGLVPEDVDLAAQGIVLYPAEELRSRHLAVQALAVLAMRERWDVIVLDPLRSFMPESVQDENANVQVGQFADFLVKLALRSGAALLVVDHDSKGGTALRGASAKGDAAVFTLHVEPDKNDPALLTLTAIKQRDPGGERQIKVRRTSLPRTPEGFLPFSLARDFQAEAESAAAPAERGAAMDQRDREIVSTVETHYRETGSGAGVSELHRRTGIAKSRISARLPHLVAIRALHRPTERGPVYPLTARPEARP